MRAIEVLLYSLNGKLRLIYMLKICVFIFIYKDMSPSTLRDNGCFSLTSFAFKDSIVFGLHLYHTINTLQMKPLFS